MADAELALLDRFYAAFDRRDGATMAACYAPGARFADPVFPDLRGTEPGAMWRMLTASSSELAVELVEREATAQRGSARWIARYTFPQTGRPVVNDVRSTFRFTGGLIEAQQDEFDFPAWSRQALGVTGLLLGRTPMLRNRVRRTARARLDRYLAEQPSPRHTS